MSSNLVEVRKINAVRPHPNADRLELAFIGGWQCVVPKGKYIGGELVTYIPTDSIIPVELSERLGITKYLTNGRVRAARLRGEPSYGVVMEPMGKEGENVADKLGIVKYVPELKFAVGDTEPSDPRFHAYTDIENLRHYPTVLEDGETVVVTEKIHGTNCRIGLVRDGGEPKRVAGSRTLQRKYSEDSTYWFPWTIPEVENMLISMLNRHPSAESVVVYGEVYGKVQSLQYGLSDCLRFRAFDIAIDGRFLDHPEFRDTCTLAGVEMAPVIYTGAYALATIVEASKGRSTIPGADHIREGVVVRPLRERTHPKVGRVVLKYVSDDYLCGDFDGANE